MHDDGIPVVAVLVRVQAHVAYPHSDFRARTAAFADKLVDLVRSASAVRADTESHLCVTRRVQRATCRAVRIALFPLPLGPVINVIFLSKFTSRCSWHMKLTMSTFLIVPQSMRYSSVELLI